MRKLVAVVGLAILIATLLPSSGAVQAQTASPEYGVVPHLLGYPESTPGDVGLITGAGFQWIKLTVPWRSVEASCKGCIDWDDLDRAVLAASSAGLKIVARVDHSPDWSRAVPAENGPPTDYYDYADFVSEMARRYAAGSAHGTINAIQVWNEPNLSREWGGTGVEPIISRRSAVEYMSLLRQSYQLIKQTNPGMIVVSAGLSPTGTNDGTAQPDDVYLTWMYENELKLNADAIGVHGPGYGSPPEADPGSNPNFPHPSFYFRRVEQLHNIMVANGDVAKQAWVMEFGWTTDQVNPQYSWYAVTPDQQADYLVRAFQYAKANWSPWIGPMFVWNMPDPTWTADNEQWWWSITETTGQSPAAAAAAATTSTPRPAYTAIQTGRANGTLP